MSCEHDCKRPPLFPKPIFNRPGLARIDYRIGNYAEVRAHLLAQLDKQPVLSAWTHRDTDDPAIALLEGASIVTDILTFYQSLYANEAYLRTAQWPQSVADLVRLGGYRLAPGVAGEASFALIVKGDRAVTVATGFGLKAQIEDSDKPVDFETRAALDAVPALSAFSLYRPRSTRSIANGMTVLRLAGNAAKLKADDRLLLGQPAPGAANPLQLLSPQVVTVEATWEAFGERYVRLKSPIVRGASIASLQAYKLGETLRHFGHNAPNTVTTVDSQGVPSTRPTSYQRRVNATTTPEVDPNIAQLKMPLDREFDGIQAGNTLVIQGRFSQTATSSKYRHTLVRKITDVENTSLTWGMQTGQCTMLTLDSNLLVSHSGTSLSYSDVRSLSFMQVTAAPFLVYADYINTSASSGASLRYYGSATDATALKGRRLLLVDAASEVAAEVDDVTVQSVNVSGTAGKTFHNVLLSKSVSYADYPYNNPAVTAYGNIVDASQGKTVAETPIGSGDARTLFQSCPLPKAPLSYLFDATRTPAQVPALDIYVEGIKWKRVDTLFNAGPQDQVYIVREDQDGNSVAQFGDGKTGARLSSGRNNVAAVYRVGIGAYGAQKADTKAQATGKLSGLDKVLLPLDVTTGADPESADNAREAAPVKLQSLGRLVSIADYEAETRMLPNVLKAAARWDAPDGVPAIVMTVLTSGGGSTDLAKVRDALTGYNHCRGPARHPILVINGVRQYLHLNAAIGYDPAYRTEDLSGEIKLALGVAGDEDNGIDGARGLFGVQRRSFHESVHTSEAIGAIQNITGIVWVKLLAAQLLSPGTLPQPDPTLLPLPSVNLIPSPVITCPTSRLLALHTKHCVLSFTSAAIQAECPT